MPLMLQGIGIPCGIAMGAVRHGGPPVHTIIDRSLTADEVPAEVRRFRHALVVAQRQLRQVKRMVPRGTAADIRSFLDSHLLMMQDHALTDAVIERIRSGPESAGWALLKQRDALLEIFERVDDPYLRTRRDDVAHVVERILAALDVPGPGVEKEMTPGSIEVAESLGPADVLQLHQHGVAGFVTESGGPLSHAAIVARSLGLPAVVGVRGARTLLRNGETVVIDPATGTVTAGPDDRTILHYRRLQRIEARERRALRAVQHLPSVTRDGLAVSLLANIDQPEDLRAVRRLGVSGIGLYRTEFLFLNRDEAPDEDEQFTAYAKVVDGMNGRPVTIRTLDLGADKAMGAHVATGDNPAMGLRAIRLGLREPGLMMPQLRALLRAAERGPIEIMLPMVTHPLEVRQFRSLLAQARSDLTRRGVACRADIPVGVMIEVPAAALSAEQLARAADFLSIGTNDLIQYTLAVDRGNEEVNYLHEPLHPAVLRLISSVIRAGRSAGVPVSMCGEMAGDPQYTGLLLGLGLTVFSMHTAHVLEVKHALRRVEMDQARRLAAGVLRTREPTRARELLESWNDALG